MAEHGPKPREEGLPIFRPVDDINHVMVDGEVRVRLANGCTVYSGWSDHADPEARVSGDYLRLEDPEGQELLYFDSADWLGQPDNTEAIGEFINACAGFLQGNHMERYDFFRRQSYEHDSQGRPTGIPLTLKLNGLEHCIRNGATEDALGHLFDLLDHVAPGYQATFDTGAFPDIQRLCDYYGAQPTIITNHGLK